MGQRIMTPHNLPQKDARPDGDRTANGMATTITPLKATPGQGVKGREVEVDMDMEQLHRQK